MDVELECKFLNVDAEALREKLPAVGATLVHAERLMRRKIFDYPDERLHKEQRSWIRVRDEGDQITMSFKKQTDATFQGVKELMLTVSDFNKACGFLEAIGLKELTYAETKREKWKFGKNEITIDSWPYVPTIMEIEGESEADIQKLAEDLGFDWSNAMFGVIEDVYMTYYDVTREQINTAPTYVFGPVPEWLESKKR